MNMADDKARKPPQSPNAGDVALAKDLLLWARKNGIAINHFMIGGVEIVARDLKPRPGAGPEVGPSDIYTEHGLSESPLDPDAPD